MTDRRVSFDFEVEFSNGGGIQGQGFRLDIEGDSIADDALAAYIIRDMRLLMVGKLRILNKQIVTEPHKRAAAGGIPLFRSAAEGAGVGTFPVRAHAVLGLRSSEHSAAGRSRTADS